MSLIVMKLNEVPVIDIAKFDIASLPIRLDLNEHCCRARLANVADTIGHVLISWAHTLGARIRAHAELHSNHHTESAFRLIEIKTDTGRCAILRSESTQGTPR